MRTRYVWITMLLCVALLGGGFAASAQEERAETPRTISSLPTTFGSGILTFLSMPNSGDTIDVSGGTSTEPNEPMPDCSGGVLGTYSVWFSVNHPGGTLTIDTSFDTGSSYDTVVQVFAYDTQSITDLLEIACDDDSGGGSSLNDARVSTVLGSAQYLVRISCKAFCVGGTTDLALSISFTPPAGATPLADSINNQVPITFNKAVKVDNVGYTTVASTENSTLSSCTMHNTAWHRFIAPRSGYYTFSTYGSRLVRPYESQDTKLAVYTSSGGPVFTNLTEQGCDDDSPGSLYSVLNGIYITQGAEVYVRVGTFSSGNFLSGSQYRITISPETISDLGTNRYFDAGMTGWTAKNTTFGDGIYDDAGNNVFRLFGALNKTAKLKQNVVPSTLLLDKADAGGSFRLLASYTTANTLSTNAKFILKVTYSDGTPATKATYNTLRITAAYQSISLVAPIASKNVSKVTMMLKNKSDGGEIRVDNFQVDYMGNPARERKGDGLLPLPAPAWRSDDAAFRGQN